MVFLKQISILCILSGPILQLILGWLSNKKRVKMNLNKVVIISVFVHLIFTFAGIRLMGYILAKESNASLTCGMPIIGLIVLSGYFFILLLIIYAIQDYLKSKNR